MFIQKHQYIHPKMAVTLHLIFFIHILMIFPQNIGRISRLDQNEKFMRIVFRKGKRKEEKLKKK